MENSDLNDVHKKVSERLSTYRSLEAFILRSEVIYLWSNSTIEEKESLRNKATKGDLAGVKRWVREHRLTDISEWTQVAIFELARKLKIRYYTKLSKKELVEEIKNAQRSNGSRDQRNGDEHGPSY